MTVFIVPLFFCRFKGIVHPKIIVLSSPSFVLLSLVDHKRSYFEICVLCP